MNNDLSELKETILQFEMAAKYNIFSQISLHEYFKFMHQNNRQPYELPSLQLLNSETQTLIEFVNEANRISDKALLNTKRHANAFVTRNWLKEVFRVVESYCFNTKQEGKLKSQSWYNFARIHVNSMSHDFKFSFQKNIVKLLKENDVQYKCSFISLSMDGKTNVITLQVLFELAVDISNFVRNDLS